MSIVCTLASATGETRVTLKDCFAVISTGVCAEMCNGNYNGHSKMCNETRLTNIAQQWQEVGHSVRCTHVDMFGTSMKGQPYFLFLEKETNNCWCVLSMFIHLNPCSSMFIRCSAGCGADCPEARGKWNVVCFNLCRWLETEKFSKQLSIKWIAIEVYRSKICTWREDPFSR